MRIWTTRPVICIIALFVLLLNSCQRSQFASTTRTSKNGRVLYVNHYRHESRERIPKIKSCRKQTNNNDLQSSYPSENRNKSLPEISGMKPVERELSDNLIASTSNEPILTLIKKNNAISVVSRRVVCNSRLSQDTISKQNQTQTGDQGTQPAKKRVVEKHGLTGFILSLFALIPFIGLPFGILGIVFGIKSLRTIRRNPELYRGRGFAIASIIIGALGIAVTIFFIGIVAALQAWTNSGDTL